MVGSKVSGIKVEIKGFPAKIEALYDMLAFVREEAERAGFAPPLISRIELACEEALVNIISYGYQNTPSKNATLEIECSPIDKGIKILLRDQGIAFNPLENQSRFNPKVDNENCVGGYGVFFILNLMDEVTYSREDNFNILTLIKLL